MTKADLKRFAALAPSNDRPAPPRRRPLAAGDAREAD
jgi:hypothetical protein